MTTPGPIGRLTLTDFKSHGRTDIELRPLTVLVGPNGVGKTSLLTALHLVGGGVAAVRELLKDPTVHPRHLLRRGTQSSTIKTPGSELMLSELISSVTGRQAWEAVWSQGIDDQPGRTEVDWTGPDLPDPFSTTEPALRTVRFFRLEGRALAAPSPATDEPTLASDGAGLASVLAALRLAEPERFEAILADLRGVLPTLKTVRIRQVKVRTEREDLIGFGLFFDFAGADDLPAHAVSEGTLIALALLTALHIAEGPTLLLIDDIEKALHPTAQWALIDLLRATLARHPQLQIVASSHSPYLVDRLEPAEVVVVNIDPNAGVTHCRTLAEHPRVDRAMQILNTGEFLSSVGEAWVLEAGNG
jgi:predicted ATPase